MDADRREWTLAEVRALYRTPLLDLAYRAAGVHRAHHDPREIQVCSLLSVKTGGCPEDCAYCPQSARRKSGVEAEKLMDAASVIEAARKAKEAGSTRFCMGAAWREVHDGRDFAEVLRMIRGVRALGLEACATLGMVTREQARRLAEAGLNSYNHNLDTSDAFYPSIIGTRTYEDRLRTLNHIAEAGIAACCGGIIGMGEGTEDRIALLHSLASLRPQPESVPINVLVPVAGTPLQDRPPVPPFEFVRMIAAARILMPRAMVRLSAGRLDLSPESQALAFLAGANSIFSGERLLTTPNPGRGADEQLFAGLGLRPRPPHKDHDPIAPRKTEPAAR